MSNKDSKKVEFTRNTDKTIEFGELYGKATTPPPPPKPKKQEPKADSNRSDN